MLDRSSNVDHSDYLSMRYFTALDGLRCVCILAVIWHHTPHTFVSDHWGFLSGQWAHRGFLGVDAFFALSGFLIVTLLLRERNRTGKIQLGAFYARRFLRLSPPYYVLLAVVTLAFWTARRGTPQAEAYLQALPFYVFYLANWLTLHAANMSILWSLATEEQFYLVWPFIEKFTSRFTTMLLLAALLLLNQAINYGILDELFQRVFHARIMHLEIMECTFTPILLGVCLAHLLHQPMTYQRTCRVLQLPAVPWLLLLAFAALCLWGPADISGTTRLCLQLTVTAFIGTLVVQPKQMLGKLLSHPVFTHLGVISYGMYLYHMWCIDASIRVLQRIDFDNEGAILLTSIAITIVTAEVSYRAIERPFLKWKEKLRK